MDAPRAAGQRSAVRPTNTPTLNGLTQTQVCGYVCVCVSTERHADERSPSRPSGRSPAPCAALDIMAVEADEWQARGTSGRSTARPAADFGDAPRPPGRSAPGAEARPPHASRGRPRSPHRDLLRRGTLGPDSPRARNSSDRGAEQAPVSFARRAPARASSVQRANCGAARARPSTRRSGAAVPARWPLARMSVRAPLRSAPYRPA